MLGALLAAVAAVGCAQASSPARTGGPPPATTDESPAATTAESPTDTTGSRAPAAGPAYYLVAPEDLVPAVASRRAALIASGQQLRADEVGYYMDVQEARLRQVAASGVLVTRAAEQVVLRLPGALGFQVGSATLTDAATDAIRVLARVLLDYDMSVVAVRGHTDASGDSASNQRLSEQRALTVARHLIAAGVSAERIVIAGFGALQPIRSNATLEGRESNRRVELHLTPLGR